MSHYTVLIIGENPEEQLAPFNEGIVVPRYVEYTKQELVEKERAFMKRYKKEVYQKFLDNKEKYKVEHRLENHIRFLEETFPKIMKYSDEELYQYTIQSYEPETIGPNGEIYSTYNPKSKWDWYALGGRWKDYFTLKDGSSVNAALKSDITKPITSTFAVLLNGEWYEKGKMGWWATVSDEKTEEDWDTEFHELIDSVPEDTLFSLYDCHI